MSTFTENYNLIKPSEGDYYDVSDFNENMDALDTLLAENETAMEQVNEKIGTPEDMGKNTVFGLLKNGNSFIKSIQYVKQDVISSTYNININTVDPAKCIVILERLKCSPSKYISVDYTLEASAITVTTDSSGYSASVGFWVIEFY